MGKASTRANKNIYFKQREKLGLTREQAGEFLETIPPERIERIENEKSKPYPDEILIMADKYKNPHLANYYCSHDCPIGQRYVPEIQMNVLSEIVLRMLASLNQVQNRQEKLIEITADGVIHEDEVRDFVHIQESLEQISMSVEALQLWTEQMLANGKINRQIYEQVKEQVNIDEQRTRR